MRKPNQTAPEVIERRRAIIAEMVAKGATIREMTRILDSRGEVNPETEKPWDNATVGRDVLFLRDAWKAQASQTILDHKARLLAEINAVKRDAWKVNDHRVILESIKSERQLLGLDSPLKIQAETRYPLEKPRQSYDEKAKFIAGFERVWTEAMGRGWEPTEAQEEELERALLAAKEEIEPTPKDSDVVLAGRIIEILESAQSRQLESNEAQEEGQREFTVHPSYLNNRP